MLKPNQPLCVPYATRYATVKFGAGALHSAFTRRRDGRTEINANRVKGGNEIFDWELLNLKRERRHFFFADDAMYRVFDGRRSFTVAPPYLLSLASFFANRFRWLAQAVALFLAASSAWQLKQTGQIQPPQVQRPQTFAVNPGLL